jgi:hypothetical protein
MSNRVHPRPRFAEIGVLNLEGTSSSGYSISSHLGIVRDDSGYSRARPVCTNSSPQSYFQDARGVIKDAIKSSVTRN